MSFFLNLNFNCKYKILLLGVGESVLRGCWLLSDPSAIPPPWVLACRLGWWHEVTGPQIAKRLEKIRFEGTENIFSLISNWGPVTSCLVCLQSRLHGADREQTPSQQLRQFQNEIEIFFYNFLKLFRQKQLKKKRASLAGMV